MKAEIRKNGSLELVPETEVEHYAMSKWLKDWEDKKVTFCVRMDHPHTPGATTPLAIKPQEPTYVASHP